MGAITALIIEESWLHSRTISANPTPENTLIQKINNLKRSGQPWIEIDLSDQHLFVWENKNQIFTAVISTGKATTPTHPGIYTIQRKYPQDRMRGADYDIADVPNVLYFDRGYALHGAYWHNSFGKPVSHGCINLPVNNAQWLFDWTKIGTPVIIHD
ncbi:MAG: L,D-transpeptidase [Xenococcaceae cyanobacterium MO_188.B32]|nr:L,D-transpeptidase [Xenococcaceae cyanobacterium MO_188.B32]